MMSVRLKGSAWGTGGGRWCLHGGASPEMKRRAAALFWASGAASGQKKSEGKRRLRCSGFRSACELGVLGAAAGSPRRCRGGGRAKLRRGRGEGKELQRAGSWVQKRVGAPREAEAKSDLAGGDPARRRAAWRCRRRGKQGSREKGERGPSCNIRKFQGPECKTRITF